MSPDVQAFLFMGVSGLPLIIGVCTLLQNCRFLVMNTIMLAPPREEEGGRGSREWGGEREVRNEKGITGVEIRASLALSEVPLHCGIIVSVLSAS